MPEWYPQEESTIPKAVWYVAPVLVLAAAAGGYWYYTKDKATPPPPATDLAPVAPEPMAAEPAVRNPIPSGASDQALPPLDQSDAGLRAGLSQLADAKTLDQYLVPDNLVRNFVVTIDNLARSKVAVERRPVKPVPGALIVETQGEEITLSEANFVRYEPYVKLIESLDAKQLAAVYLSYYPLFQESYQDLGYPDGYFNDRLVEVIDHLLETPAPKGPVRLTQPKVFYEFADPQLEARTPGQKLLLRMGTANATLVKAKLRELRAEIVSVKTAG